MLIWMIINSAVAVIALLSIALGVYFGWGASMDSSDAGISMTAIMLGGAVLTIAGISALIRWGVIEWPWFN